MKNYNTKIIRLLDILLVLLASIILIPIFIFISLLIVIDSRGGVFYKQNRVGLEGKLFQLYKFRTMKPNSDKLGLLTIGQDNRITQIGKVLRKYKLDELPQLINVLLGEMSLVGPRPEVEKYVKLYTADQRIVLSIKPGVSDYASIAYIDENKLLAESKDPENTYITEIMPSKLKYNMKYIEQYGVKEYFKVIFLTIHKILR